MIITCEHCGVELEVDDKNFGQKVRCYNCGTEFVCDQYVLSRMVNQLRKEKAERVMPSAGRTLVRPKRLIVRRQQPPVVISMQQAPSAAAEKPSHPILCFLLGFFLGNFFFIGIILSAIIDGGRGAIRALCGWLFAWLLGILLFALYCFVMSNMV